MLAEHVDVDGACIAFDFTAKGGLARNVYVEDRRLAKIVRGCSELGGQDLFTYETAGGIADVTSSDVNAYLRDVIGEGVTAKHFRTWGGTVSAAAACWPSPALRRPTPRPTRRSWPRSTWPSTGPAMLSGSAAPSAGLTLRQELRLASARRPATPSA